MSVRAQLSTHDLELLGRLCGEQWVGELDEVVEGAVSRWQLTEVSVLARGHNALVLSASQRHLPVAIKIHRDASACSRQAGALRRLPARCAPRVLDEHDRTLLLERVLPGTPLSSAPALTPALLIDAARVLRRIHTHQVHADDADMYQRWGQWAGEHPQLPASISQALRLLGQQDRPVRALHGDAHAGNLLRGLAGWQVVDVEGVRGDPAYDIATLCLLWPHLQAGPPDAQILAVSEALRYDARRARLWARVRAWQHSEYLAATGTDDASIDSMRAFALSAM